MATINTSKTGFVIGQSSGTFATARQNGSSVVANPTTSTTYALKYRTTSGRGSLTHAFARTFLYFDTSGISGTVSSTSIDIVGNTAGDADYIVLKSTAFGGDGSSNLVTGDFYSTIDYSTPYTSEITTWSRTGINNISLNATANTDIQNNTAFIVALVEYDADYSNTAGVSAGDIYNGISFGTTITLTYTEAGPSGYTHDVIGIPSANISKVVGVATANISKIIGV